MSIGMNHIELRGVRVHNLKQIDLDLPHHRLIAICGVSGSGKTSLALDTLFAEGQRRYVETFSAATRQLLEQLEKPDAERIGNLPPAIAFTRRTTVADRQLTVGGATEIDDYLRLLFARVGQMVCPDCQVPVERHSATSCAERLVNLPSGTRYQVAFPAAVASPSDAEATAQIWIEDGFQRAIVAGATVPLADLARPANQPNPGPAGSWPAHWLVVVDRLAAGEASRERATDSLETAFLKGEGQAVVLIEDRQPVEADRAAPTAGWPVFPASRPLEVDRRRWRQWDVADTFRCGGCRREFASPDPRLFHCQSPLGACPVCEGTGHERPSLPAAKKGGGKKERAEEPETCSPCPACHGTKLCRDALAIRLGGAVFPEYLSLPLAELSARLTALPIPEFQQPIAAPLIEQILHRCRFLQDVGLSYLRLERPLATLSGGETQRVSLTSALGSQLVNMLYVLDEPTVGLHPREVPALVQAVRALCDRGNTVVAVEHHEELIRAADQIIEIGPGAGAQGGEVCFQGTWSELLQSSRSPTADFLAGRRGVTDGCQHRETKHGWLRLRGASGRNLRQISVDFPLGVLCVVTGVSGAGKSTLVRDTLYPALCARKGKTAPRPLPYEDLFGDDQIEDVLLIDTSPVGRSPRSNPVTYVKAFDEIRQVFAATLDARTRNFTASDFSFNVDGGRCPTCSGDGFLEIDMQFMADVYMKCADCQGTRYRREILEVRHRGCHIAEVLNFTVREAFSFFRGQTKVQEKLKRLIDVGLDYVRLGQPANTLSAGESQRLKLAAHLATATRRRTLFLLDEPTAGLHRSDILQLLDCFDALLAIGHSLLVMDHNPHFVKAADYLIELGPGAAEDGGQVLAAGPLC